MSEPSREEWKLLAGVFLPEYNKVNSSAFEWVEDAPRTANSDKDFLDPKGNVLAVQHTVDRGTEYDQLGERVIYSYVAESLIPIIQPSLEGEGVKARIHLSLHINPRRGDTQRIAQIITERVIRAYREGLGSDGIGYSLYLEEGAREMGELSPWVTVLSIWPDDELGFSYGHREYPLRPRGVLHSSARFENALKAKLAKPYQNAHDLVLLINFEGSPMAEHELPDMKVIAQRHEGHFKSIWAIQLWGGGKAYHIC